MLRPAQKGFVNTSHSRDPIPGQLTTSELRAIQEQSELMRTKAEQAKEARRRQEEERERLQKERSALKLRELEERMRLKKEKEAKEKAAAVQKSLAAVKPVVSSPVSKPVVVSAANPTPKVSTNVLSKPAVSAASVAPTMRPKPNVPVTSPVNTVVNAPAKVTLNVSSKPTPNVPAKATPNVPAKVTPNVPAKVTPNVPAKITPNVPAKITQNVSAKTTPNVSAKVTLNAPAKVIPNTPARVIPNASARSTPNAPANVSSNVSSSVPTNAPTKAYANAPTIASSRVSGTVPTNTFAKASTAASTNAPPSITSGNASNSNVVINASAKTSTIETELSSAATLSQQSQLSTPNISVDGIESSVSSSPRVVLQRPKTVPPSISQESSLSNVSNRHSGMGRGAPRDHGPQRRHRNAPTYRGGNTHHNPRSNNYDPKSGHLQHQRHHPRRSSAAAHSSSSRNYDGPNDNETRDEWLERRRKQTETRTAVRSIIETIINRAVNGGRSPPRRQHQHNQRRGGSGASSNRRERGRGSGLHGLRRGGDYGLRDNERGRFGQGLRPQQGLRINMPKSMVHGPNLPLGRGRPLIPVVHSPSNLLKPLIESLKRKDLLSRQRAEGQSSSKVPSENDSPSHSMASTSPQLPSPTVQTSSTSAMKDSIPEKEQRQLVQSNDAAEPASVAKSPSQTSKTPTDSSKPSTSHESPQSINETNEQRSRPSGGSSRPSHSGRPHHGSRRPTDSRRPYPSRFSNRTANQQGYVQRHRPSIPRNERNHTGTNEDMTGQSQNASTASNEKPVVHVDQSNGSDDNYKTEVAKDENSQVAPLPQQALDETPRKKQSTPTPIRLAPWADKTQAKPGQIVGLSPMAALRAKQADQATPHDNGLQSTEESQQSTIVMTASTNSTLADDSTQPVGSDLTPSHSAIPSSGMDNQLVSSPVQAMEAKVKSVKIPSSLGGNVKVLMNPNTRQESGNNTLPNGYGRSSVIVDVDQLRPNGPNPTTHGTGLGSGSGNSRGSRDAQSNNATAAASEQLQPDIPDSVNVTNLESNGPGVDAGDGSSMFGPALSSLGLINGKEDSLAWFSSGGPPSATPSFDAIKRAFSNQSSRYPIVDAPLIPQIPAVSADATESTSPVVSPARAETVDGKRSSWGSKLWNNGKNGSNWSKPWAKTNTNTGEAHGNNRNDSSVSTDAKLSTPRTGNVIASPSTASETLAMSTERQSDVNVSNVDNQKNYSRPASLNVDEQQQQSRDASAGNRGRGNRRNMRSGGNRRGMRRNGPIANSAHGNHDRESSRQPHDGYRGRRNPRDRNDSGDRRRGANFMRSHGSQMDRHGSHVGSENTETHVSTASTNVSNTQTSVHEASMEPANALDSVARQSQTTAEVEPSARQQQTEVNSAPKPSSLETRSALSVSKEQVSNRVGSVTDTTNVPDAMGTAQPEVKTDPIHSEHPVNPGTRSNSGSGNGFFSGGPRGGAQWSRNKTVPTSYNPRGRRPARSGPRSSRRRDHPIREQTSPSASTGSVPTIAPTREANIETEKRPVAQHVHNKPLTTEAAQQPQRKESTGTPSFKPISQDGASPRSVEDMKDHMDENEVNGSRNVSNNDFSNNESSSTKITGDESAHRGSHYSGYKPRRGGRGRGYSHQSYRHHHHPRQYTRNSDTAVDRGNGQVDSHGPTSPSSVANVKRGRQVDQVVSAANQNMAAANHVDTTSRDTASQKMVNTGDAVSKTDDNGVNGSSTQSQLLHEHGRNQLAQSPSNGTTRSSKEETNLGIRNGVPVAASGSSSTSGSSNRASVSLSVGADGIMNFNVNNGTTSDASRSGTGPSANAAVNENDNSGNGPPGPQDPGGVDSKRVATSPAENADSGESASVTARRGRGRGGRGGRGRGRRGGGGGGGGNSGVDGGEAGNNQGGGGNGRGRPYRGRSGHRGRGGRGGGFGNHNRVPAQST